MELHDRVTVNGLKGTIIAIRDINYDIEYQIQFDKEDIVGNKDWYPKSAVIKIWEDTVPKLNVDTSTHCPVCGNEWAKSNSFVSNQTWYDCIICNKTKEEICG